MAPFDYIFKFSFYSSSTYCEKDLELSSKLALIHET